MEKKMFCFQCEQTAGCSACTGAAGVCGKKADTAKLQDKLTGALIGLARSTEGNEDLVTPEINKLVIEALFATLTNVNFNDEELNRLIERVYEAKMHLVPECSHCVNACGKNDDYDLELIWNDEEDVRSLKSLILFGIRGLAAYAYHAEMLGYRDKEIPDFLYKALFAIGMEWGVEALLPIALEVGKINYKCMELLDKANTETFGTPVPTEVPLTIEKGPFIVISGHDL